MAARASLDTGTCVEDAMVRRFVHVRPHLPLSSLARLLCETGLLGVPVVSRSDQLVGWIGAREVLAATLESPSIAPVPPDEELGEDAVWLRRGFHVERHAGALTVGDVMDPEPITVEEGASLEAALELMLLDGSHELPVVSAEGRVRGLLSDIDALATLLAAGADEDPNRPVRRAGRSRTG